MCRFMVHTGIDEKHTQTKVVFFLFKISISLAFIIGTILFNYLIPRSYYRAITTIAIIVSDRDIQAKTKI